METRNSLTHWGVLGQKWGIRRYQNEDGTYTALGAEHRKNIKEAEKQFKQQVAQKTAQKVANKVAGTDTKQESVKDMAKQILKGAAITAATTLMAREMVTIYDNDIVPMGQKAAEAIIPVGKQAADAALREIAKIAVNTLVYNSQKNK